jgi:chromosome segregation ATPase
LGIDFPLASPPRPCLVSQAENRRLRERLEALSREAEAERAEMEAKVAQVIHNSAGQVSRQRAAVADLSLQLTAELSGWQAKCAEQKEEIEGLKQLVGALEGVRSAKGATAGEVRDMQAVLDAWQAQAAAAQAELVAVSGKLQQAAEARARDRAKAAELERELEQVRPRRGIRGIPLLLPFFSPFYNLA